MAHTPALTSFVPDIAAALAEAQDTTPAHTGHRPAAPTETGGTPHSPGTAGRASQIHEATSDAAIYASILGNDAALAERNFNILKRRLGHNFAKIMSSPGAADAVRDVKLEYNFDIQARQDSALAKRLMNASAVPLPSNIKPGEFGVAPLDIMPYEDQEKSGFHATILEMNGSGYGNITTLEEGALDLAMKACGNVEDIIKEDPTALIIISCSGREDPPNFGASKKLHEKYMIIGAAEDSVKQAQSKIQIEGRIAQAMSDSFDDSDASSDSGLHTEVPGAQILILDTFDPDALQRDEHGNVIIIDNVAQEKPGRDKDGIAKMKEILDNTPNWHNPTQPTIIGSYTSQLANAIEVRNGIEYLNGRRVRFVGNDRLQLNVDSLNADKGEKVDPAQTVTNNRSYVPAASKSHAYAFANEFNEKEAKEEFPEFSRHIVNERGFSLKQTHEKVMEQLGPDSRKRTIIKPKGTGHGDGIAAFDVPELEDPEKILSEIEASYSLVKGTYGDRGGLPYTVSEYLTALRVNKPGHYLDTMKFELRVAVINDITHKDGPRLVAVPSIIKVDSGSKLAPGQSGDFSKKFASVSSQVLATGRPASDFMKPLLDPEVLELLGISEAELTRLCQWATRYVAYTLKNIDRVDTILPDEQEEFAKAQAATGQEIAVH